MSDSWLKDAIDKLESKIDKLDDRLSEHNAILGQQHVEIKEHIRRTGLLEEDLKATKKEFHKANADIRKDMRPMQRYLDISGFIFKAIGVATASGGVLGGIAKAITYFLR